MLKKLLQICEKDFLMNYYSLRIFDPHEVPLDKNALQNYGEEELSDLIHFYGKKKRINNDEHSLIDRKKLRKNGI